MLIYFDKSIISLNEQINQSDVLNKLSPEYSLNLLISSIPNINDSSKKRPSLKSNSINEYDMSIQKELITLLEGKDVNSNNSSIFLSREGSIERRDSNSNLNYSMNSLNISNGNIKLVYKGSNQNNQNNLQGNKSLFQKQHSINEKEFLFSGDNKNINLENEIPFQELSNSNNIINFKDDEESPSNKNNLVNQNIIPDNNNININENPEMPISKNKYGNMSISEITNQLFLIAKKQTGCRYLQKLISLNENDDLVNKYFYPKLYPTKLIELCNDLFGNYLVQKMIPYLNKDNLYSFTSLIIKHLLKLCLNPHGTRVVQVYLEQIKLDNQLLTLFTNSLIPIMPRLINDLNGSFVLMHYATVVPYPNNDIIFDFLNKNIVKISVQSYSCSALQKCIDIGNEQQSQKLLENISEHSMFLILNQFGNYVIQFVISKNITSINDKILEGFIDNLIFLAKQKYSSNVIEKCFDYCSNKMKERIINQLSDERIIRDLLKDMYGNYVLQKTLSMIQDIKKKQNFLQIVGSELPNLQYLPFGPKLIKKLVLSFPELKKYANQINLNNNNNFNNNMMNPNNYYMNMNQLNRQMINLNINNIANNISNVNNYYGMMGMNNSIMGNNNNPLMNHLQSNNMQMQNQYNMMNNYNMINRDQMNPNTNFNNFMNQNMFYN
jgi:hypothetical protein